LHDIGKIGIDTKSSEGKQTDLREFEIMKNAHVKGAKDPGANRRPGRGHSIVARIRTLDGGGYPDGLAGDKIDRLAASSPSPTP